MWSACVLARVCVCVVCDGWFEIDARTEPNLLQVVSY